MGSLYRRGSIWWLKYYQDGRPVRESSETKNKAAARRMLATREGDVVKGIPIAPKVGRITFDEAAQDIINDYTINKFKSLSDTQRRLDKHLRPFFGSNSRLSGITTDRIREFIVARQAAGAADGEINLELAALKRMFSLAKQ